jgi:hypothetical protein
MGQKSGPVKVSASASTFAVGSRIDLDIGAPEWMGAWRFARLANTSGNGV